MTNKFDFNTLAGDWHNQLGSKVHFVTDPNGGITGKYNSAVGRAEDFYVLTGRFDANPPLDEGVSVGWTVNWRNFINGKENNSHSTTTWSGQYYDKSTGVERIVTTWLLTQSTTTNDSWDSTNVGNDTFVRDKPSAAEIAKAKALSFGSPHPEELLARR
ncbi:hypothetical protein GALMADRAFT_253228 [Galerina marginata CBS 339.88]|uniref:Uncharacterized protein n=1 Tax=Galerina marginata (strain CBS 339.88) TaxID=685588 RepID=A0A067SNE5_GALM3|nr:hypothetical protein GALMADRAFT_253228 [Galerina marginata CBS 339.88]